MLETRKEKKKKELYNLSAEFVFPVVSEFSSISRFQVYFGFINQEASVKVKVKTPEEVSSSSSDTLLTKIKHILLK